jgi:glycosyltransferase involved in cell wall biosynthesis
VTKYKGKVEHVRGICIEGWLQGGRAEEAVDVRLDIDDRDAGAGIADQNRPDLHAAGVDDARGFSLTVPLHLRDGRVHKITVRAGVERQRLGLYPLIAVIERTALKGPDGLPPKAMPAPSSRVTVVMPPHLEGFCDGVRNGAVYGWIRDREAAEPVRVTLFVDNVEILTAPAGGFRKDVHEAGMGTGSSGFNFALPQYLHDGQPHRVDVRLAEDHGHALFAPVFITVDPPEGSDIVFRGQIDAIQSGKARTLVRGWLSDADGGEIAGPVVLSLGGESVTVPCLAQAPEEGPAAGRRACFAVVFPTLAKMPAVLSATAGGLTQKLALDGRAVRKAPLAGYVQAAGDAGLSGYAVDLDSTAGPATVALCVADLKTTAFPLGGGACVHDAAGPLPVHFRLTAAEVLDAARAADSGFALSGDTAAVKVAGTDGETVRIRANRPIRLHVEHFTETRVSGWAIDPVDKDRLAGFDVYVDDVRYQTVTAAGERGDLIAKGLTHQGGGFRLTPFNPHEEDADVRIRFAPQHTRDFLPIRPDLLNLRPHPPAPLRGLFPHLQAARDRPVVVVLMAVDAETARPALEAVLRETGRPLRILVAGRGGAALKRDFPIVESLAATDLQLVAQRTGDADLVLVAAGTLVTPKWLNGLRAAAYSEPRIATATPLANAGGAFAVPEAGLINSLPPGFDFGDMARLVRRAARGDYPRVPFGGGHCLYIRRDALDRLGGFAEAETAQDFCLRATRAGALHIVDDRTYVGAADSETAVSGGYPEYPVLKQAFEAGESLLGVRWRIRAALAGKGGDGANAEPGLPQPRIAYVISTRSGGTPQTNRDLMAAVAANYDTWVIACDSRTVEVMAFRDGKEITVETLTLRTPVTPALHRNADYDDALAYVLLKYGFELVHIRHLGWHGANLPQICAAIGLPVIFSLHDFYTVCPSIKLLDESGTHCGGVCTAGAGDCAVELWPQSDFPPLKNGFIHRWRDIFADSFAGVDAFVTTSPGARDLFRSVYAGLAAADFRVIPHGRTFAQVAPAAVRPQPGERLKILVPGNISPAKGADLINAMVALDTDKRLEFHILGDSGRVAKGDTVILHGLYRREDFAAKVAAIAPHIGVVLSIWPETYCHTLTEMWAGGIPVAGIDCGAVGERLAEHGGGWRLPLGVTAAEALAQLAAITGEDWARRVAEVVAWQEGHGRIHDTAWMGGQYEDLYRTVLARRMAQA